MQYCTSVSPFGLPSLVVDSEMLVKIQNNPTTLHSAPSSLTAVLFIMSDRYCHFGSIAVSDSNSILRGSPRPNIALDNLMLQLRG